MDGNIQWVVNTETSLAKYSSVDGNISKCLKNVDKKDFIQIQGEFYL